MEHQDLIDKYFQNTLSPKEQFLFNELLHSDVSFEQEFRFQKDLKKAIRAQEQAELKQRLVNLEEKSSKGFLYRPQVKKWLAAASLTLLLALGGVLIKNSYFPSSERLYAEHFSPARNTVMPIVRGEEVQNIEYKAFAAYENQDYHKAINLFNSVENPDEAYVDFFKANCYLGLEKYEEAIALLSPLSAQMTRKHQDQWSEKASWYLGLAYLKQGDRIKAKEVLQRIDQKEESFLYKEAQAILPFLNE